MPAAEKEERDLSSNAMAEPAVQPSFLTAENTTATPALYSGNQPPFSQTIGQNKTQNTIQKQDLGEKEEVVLPMSETCEGSEDITALVKRLKNDGPAIIDGLALTDEQKTVKKYILEVVLNDEGAFSVDNFTFLACDKINLPQLANTSDLNEDETEKSSSGFSGYASENDKEIGMLKTFKAAIESFLASGNLSALLRVLKLIAHEVRHLNLTDLPAITDTDIQPGVVTDNAIVKAGYYVEEILVNAEEIAVHHRFNSQDGEENEYKVPLDLSKEIRGYWVKIGYLVTAQKATELKEYIILQLNDRYHNQGKRNTMTRGVLNAMERGNWRFSATPTP